jgi:transposase
MFLGKLYEKKTGRVRLKIVEAYRLNGKPKQRMIQDLGYLDELQKLYPDPIAHFRNVAQQMTAEKKAHKESRLVQCDPYASLPPVDPENPATIRRKNIGYAALSSLYHELGIDTLLNNRRRGTKCAANLNAIFKMLLFSRALFPDSARGAWENRGIFFEDAAYSRDEVYRALDYFLAWRPALLRQVHERLKAHYGRDTLLMYYDVTNYYFEIDEPDSLRAKGVSKEHRPNPIVQMGLLLDAQGLPVSYELYRGNTNDGMTLPSMLDDAVVDLGIHHLIVVADKGMMRGDNIAKIRLGHHGYVMSYSVRSADKDFKAYVLDEAGYTPCYDQDGRLVAKHKSRYAPREIWVTDRHGTRTKSLVNERQIVIYSAQYAQRARMMRALAIEKASGQIYALSKDATLRSSGATKYLKKVPFDTTTGECLPELEYLVMLDDARIEEDERLDGYYVICTNVVGRAQGEPPFAAPYRYTPDGFFQLNQPVTDDDIIAIYKGLWRIEETFKVMKSELKARPVFVSTESHIRAHFFICFVALLLMRLLEYRLSWRYSAAAIQQSLASACGTSVGNNLYVFDYYDPVLAAIGKNLGIDFSRQSLTLQEIRHLLAQTKRKH